VIPPLQSVSIPLTIHLCDETYAAIIFTQVMVFIVAEWVLESNSSDGFEERLDGSIEVRC
jgi:hypothetical protein